MFLLLTKRGVLHPRLQFLEGEGDDSSPAIMSRETRPFRLDLDFSTGVGSSSPRNAHDCNDKESEQDDSYWVDGRPKWSPNCV